VVSFGNNSVATVVSLCETVTDAVPFGTSVKDSAGIFENDIDGSVTYVTLNDFVVVSIFPVSISVILVVSEDGILDVALGVVTVVEEVISVIVAG
ncbi:hypothetical protein C0J52_14847, partial [Blattella germanica]